MLRISFMHLLSKSYVFNICLRFCFRGRDRLRPTIYTDYALRLRMSLAVKDDELAAITVDSRDQRYVGPKCHALVCRSESASASASSALSPGHPQQQARESFALDPNTEILARPFRIVEPLECEIDGVGLTH